MNVASTTDNRDEAQVILTALREIQDNPALLAEARKSPQSVYDRMKLSGVGRHAVAFAIAAAAVAPAAGTHIVHSQWWGH